MDCVEIADQLLEDGADGPGHDPEFDAHVQACPRCANVARGLARLDAVLGAVVVLAPPLELQHRLLLLADQAARPTPAPWWRRLGELNPSVLVAQRPQMVAVQGLAAVMLALASWQIFGWLSAFQPVVGDVVYAMELVAGSPAASYLGNLQIDVQSLGLWSLVGIASWLVSDNGLIGRRIAASGLQLP